MPDILCFAEVENRFVLNQLISSTLLHKAGYSVVHFESPDTRGIDCGLLFRDEILSLVNAFPRHLYGRDGHILTTRDILVAEFDSIAVLVNHHPSKIGGAKGGNIDLGGSNGNAGSPPDKEERRATAMATMKHLCDSLPQRVKLSIGDFNDDLWHSGGQGTIKYNGSWEKIDGCFTSGCQDVRERVYAEPALTTHDKVYGGEKPLRTYAGPKYTGGVSDHYPIAVMLYF